MTINRVRYRERQRLRAADLHAEQAYRLGADRRHLTGPHQWGIVTGLSLVVGNARELIVEPGIAVDGYGRVLIVPDLVTIPPDAFQSLDAVRMDVWLVYGREPLTAAGSGRWACGPGQHNRWHEVARLRLSAVDPESDAKLNAAWRCPPDMVTELCEDGLRAALLDDPPAEWPVFLGRVDFNQSPPILLAGRPYAGLRGERVTTPAGVVQMHTGSELASDPLRFAVRFQVDSGGTVDRLSVQRDGRITLRGDATLGQNLRLPTPPEAATSAPPRRRISECEPPDQPANGLTPVTRSVILDRLPTPPEAAAPWQLYRAPVTPENAPALDQLRLEIGSPGKEGDPALYQCVIGMRDRNGAFRRCLTVRADCTVTVHGDVELQALPGSTQGAQVIESPVDADPRDPRFNEALRNQWVGELGASAQHLEDHYTPTLALTLSELPSSVSPGSVVNYSLTVSNQGAADLFQVNVLAVITVGTLTLPRIQLAPPFDLGRMAAPREIPGSQQLSSNSTGQLTVVVTVLAFRANGRIEQVTDSRTTNIVSPIG